MEQCYLYPPPKRSDGDLIICIVEKKGDETKTSMRQSEIYAYSAHVKVRDGYTVLPKWYWTKASLGEWYLAKARYAEGRKAGEWVEQELTDLRKIDPNEYAKYKIPATRVYGCTVQIRCLFVLCPDFIQNRDTRNAFGNYKKLLIMNIGQGFVWSRTPELFNKLKPNCVYIGVFEFQAKDNGACNFGHRSSLRDYTNHILERDAMWQLTAKNREARPEECNEMNNWLKTVKQNAEEFFHELQQQGLLKRKSRSVSRPLLQCPNRDRSVADITLRQSRLSLSSTRNNISFKSQPIEGSSSRNHTLGSQPDTPNVREFQSVREFEEHRNKTIVYLSIKESSGRIVKKWYDYETKQSSPDNDILYFKFAARYKVSERPASRASSIAPRPRSRTISESSVRTNALGQPVATSTPRPSPPPSPISSPAVHRRFFDHSHYETIQMEGREEGGEGDNEGDFLNQTSNTTLLLQDNNANPVYRTPFMRH